MLLVLHRGWALLRVVSSLWGRRAVGLLARWSAFEQDGTTRRGDDIYLLGVLGTAAVALRRAVLVVIVGGHCRGWSRLMLEENGDRLAAVEQLGGEISRNKEA